MSAFDDVGKDNLEFEIRLFLNEHTIAELMQVVTYCIEEKEQTE